MAEHHSSSSEDSVEMANDYYDNSKETTHDDKEAFTEAIQMGFLNILKLQSTPSYRVDIRNKIPKDFRVSYERMQKIEMDKKKEIEEKAMAEDLAKQFEDENKERKELLTGHASRSRKRKSESSETPQDKLAKRDDEAGGSGTSQ